MGNTEILHLDSCINNSTFRNKTVKEILVKNKRNIFNLIKEGYYFDDEVLQLAGISKRIKDISTTNQFVEHIKDIKVYEVDKTPLHKILKELATIEGYSDNYVCKDEEENSGEDEEIEESEQDNE